MQSLPLAHYCVENKVGSINADYPALRVCFVARNAVTPPPIAVATPTILRQPLVVDEYAFRPLAVVVVPTTLYCTLLQKKLARPAFGAPPNYVFVEPALEYLVTSRKI